MPDDQHDAREPGTFTRAEVEALQAAGVIETHEPGSPDADAFAQAMVVHLEAFDAELLEREGPDALTSERLLRQTALAAESNPALVESALAAYRDRQGWTRDQLATWLGLTSASLALLALEPRDAEVDALAERYGVDRGRLVLVLAGGPDHRLGRRVRLPPAARRRPDRRPARPDAGPPPPPEP